MFIRYFWLTMKLLVGFLAAQIGDFVWTAMDYLGESGVGHSLLSNQKNPWFMPWPLVDNPYAIPR